MTKFPLQSPLKILGPSTWIAWTDDPKVPKLCSATRMHSDRFSGNRGSFEQWISPSLLPKTTLSWVTDNEVTLYRNLARTCPVKVRIEGWSSWCWCWYTLPFFSPENTLCPRTFKHRMSVGVTRHDATQFTSRIFQTQNNFWTLVTPIKSLNSTSLSICSLVYCVNVVQCWCLVNGVNEATKTRSLFGKIFHCCILPCQSTARRSSPWTLTSQMRLRTDMFCGWRKVPVTSPVNRSYTRI